MLPFTDLDELRRAVAAYDDHVADNAWLLAWTGLRRSEVCALHVGDLIEMPISRLVVRRSARETVDANPTKNGRTPQVP